MIILSKKTILIILSILLLGSWITLHRFRTPEPPLIVTPLPTQPLPKTPKPKPPPVWIHIAGEVQKPGVYHIPKGTRTLEAIEYAGGLTPNADLDRLKLAKVIKDGDTIWVKSKKKDKAASSSKKQTFPIQINHASIETLTQLQGIGPKMAKKIVQNRPYDTPKDLLKVKGIGPKRIQKWRNQIQFE